MKESKNVFKLSKAVLNKETSDEKIDSASDSEAATSIKAKPTSPDKTERKKGAKESKMKLFESKKEDSEADKDKFRFSFDH